MTILPYEPTATIEQMLKEWRVRCYCEDGTEKYIEPTLLHAAPITQESFIAATKTRPCIHCKGSGSIQPYSGIADWLKAHEGTEWPCPLWVGDSEFKYPPSITWFEGQPSFRGGIQYIHALTPEQALLVLEEITGMRFYRTEKDGQYGGAMEWYSARPSKRADTSTELVLAILGEVGA